LRSRRSVSGAAVERHLVVRDGGGFEEVERGGRVRSRPVSVMFSDAMNMIVSSRILTAGRPEIVQHFTADAP
jgi:hypothetical protein